VEDPIAEVRFHASDALAVALGALWHFSQRPTPLDELTAAHVKRASQRISAATLASVLGGTGSGGVVVGVGEGTPLIPLGLGTDTPTGAQATSSYAGIGSLASSSLSESGSAALLSTSISRGYASSSAEPLVPSADDATISVASKCLEETLRDLVSMVDGRDQFEVGGPGGMGVGKFQQPSHANAHGHQLPPGTHNGRVAYATMCKAIFGIRDKHAVDVDGVSMLIAERTRALGSTSGGSSAASEEGGGGGGAGGTAGQGQGQGPAPSHHHSPEGTSEAVPAVFDPRTDTSAVLASPVCLHAPAAAAFVCAHAFVPQSLLGDAGGSSSASASSDAADPPLPRWWKEMREAAAVLYTRHGVTVPGGTSEPGGGAVLFPAAAALPVELRAALVAAQPHAPKLRTAEELRRAACSLYDVALKLPLLRLLRHYRPGSFWWREIAPLAGSVACTVAEREWRPVLQRESLDRHLAARIRKQRWKEEEDARAAGTAPSAPVIRGFARMRAWSGMAIGAGAGAGAGAGGGGGGGGAAPTSGAVAPAPALNLPALVVTEAHDASSPQGPTSPRLSLGLDLSLGGFSPRAQGVVDVDDADETGNGERQDVGFGGMGGGGARGAQARTSQVPTSLSRLPPGAPPLESVRGGGALEGWK
jgi:hypothetical protein